LAAPRRGLEIASGLALTAGLVWFGFAVTGAKVSALAPSVGPGGIAPLPGSTTTHAMWVFDGQRTRVSECRTPSPASTVMTRYEALARDEASARDAPYMIQEEEGGGGALVWVAPDGRRRAVLVAPDPAGGTLYRLLEAPAPDTQPGAPRRLPGGVACPVGYGVALSVERPTGGGFALLQAHSPPSRAAEACVAALGAAGITVDPTAAAVLASGGATDRGDAPLTLPLVDDRGPRGVLVVAPDGEGGARASLTLE
jgi:hypothetical protein